MVLPKDLRKYLPSLDEAATSFSTPTVDRYLAVEMYDGFVRVARGAIRYQLQTWGGTRSAESRLTEGFSPLRERARGGDVVIFQRRADSLQQFRMVLVHVGSPEYRDVSPLIGSRKWGSLLEASVPVSQMTITEAKRQIENLEGSDFVVKAAQINRLEARQSRIARSVVFRERVQTEYSRTCAISGISIRSPASVCEVESAHIVPISEGGMDDIRNGLALSQTIHWAFDRGLIGVNDQRAIVVPRKVASMPQNKFLLQFTGKKISEAQNPALRAHPEALHWHFENRVKQWS